MAGGARYYGWTIAWALGATTTVSWGILFYAFSVFLRPMEADLGWTRAELSGAFTIALVVSGLVAPIAGRWIDRHGARALMTGGSILGTLLLLAWAAVRSLPPFYLVWTGIGVAMACTLYDPAFAVLARWFDRGRGRAMMIVTLLAGLASTIFLPVAAWLVELQGWRAALVSLAVILAVATIPPHALLLRRRPEDLGLDPDPPLEPASRFAAPTAGSAVGGSFRSLLTYPPFVWLAVAFWLYGLASVGLGIHLVPYLSERGYPPTLAALATGAVGAAQLLGRIAFAPLEGRVPRRWLVAATLGAQPLALLALLGVPGEPGLYAFIVLFGISRGAATLARATLVASRYGPARFGAVNGALSLAVTFAHAFAPVALGAAHDVLSSYEPALWVLLTLGVVATAAVVLAEPD
ncbi:MAG TPA: MFS transporter [Chloroflexota bacterium]|nr:MFS transporter [Chloroflexota bacterium]